MTAIGAGSGTPSRGRQQVLEVARATLSGAEAQGLAVEGLLREAGLDPELVRTAPGNTPIPSEAVGRLAAALRRALKDEGLGFLRRPLRPGFSAHMCRSAIAADTLREAYFLAGEFFYIAHEDLRFRLVEGGDQARVFFRVRSIAKDHRFFIAMLFTCLIRWTNWMLGKHLMLESFEWRGTRPGYVDQIRELFPCTHAFHQTQNCITFPRRFLDRPIIQSAETLKAQLPELGPNLIAGFVLDASLTTQVRRLLQEREPADMPSLGQVAQHLALGVDTLGRRLRAEGNTFAEIGHSVRHDRAVRLLTSTDTSLAAIAHELGYSEPSSFNRAFKRHTGVTPGAYREQRR